LRDIDDPDAPDDAALADAACAGDVRAFEALVRRHESRVLRVLRLLGVPLQEREDVAQEVFLRVFRHLATFDRKRSFSSWIYKVSVNASHDWRDRATNHVGLASAPELLTHPQEDLARRLEVALASLTDREREVFVLKELEGLETEEVARSLGLNAITVRRHLSLARERLRKVLEG
jgi:RNA polymerase sigma-70 factor (ECF subfamily)